MKKKNRTIVFSILESFGHSETIPLPTYSYSREKKMNVGFLILTLKIGTLSNEENHLFIYFSVRRICCDNQLMRCIENTEEFSTINFSCCMIKP